MRKRQITATTIKKIKVFLKTKTYHETAIALAKTGFKTPGGKKPTIYFVNYVATTYL